jgi:hypothetical protein
MARRNLDGTYKNNNTASRVSNRTLIARWVEAEVLETKQFVVSFAHAARHITAVVHAQEPPLIPLFPGIIFPSDYKISAAACHKAYCRALNREPKLGVEHLRAELMLRCNHLWSAAQQGIGRGDPRTMAVAARTVETMWLLGGAKSGTPSLPVARESKHERTSPAVIDLFKSAIEYLLGMGEQLEGYQIIRLEEKHKAIETTAREDPGIEGEQAIFGKK